MKRIDLAAALRVGSQGRTAKSPPTIMLWRAIILAAAGIIGFAMPAYTAIITVYKTADALAGSLRQAIQDASPGDTIVFHIPTTEPGYDSFTGGFTIGLTSGELVINKNLTIDGGGQKIWVQRLVGNPFRLVNVTAGSVVISGLTFVNGRPATGGLSGGGGGAIYNASALVVRGCMFTDNHGGDQGGALYNATGANLTVENCTLTNNRPFGTSDAGGFGGAIYNIGTLTVRDSTIVGNTAITPEGMNIISPGGGIYNHNSGTARLLNTIIALNTARSGSDVSGNFISDGYNLLSSGAGSTGFGATGDQIGVSSAQMNLGALQDNGGPSMTMRPLPGSVAIDQGKRGLDANNQPINIDQRNLLRPVDLPGIPNAVGGDGSDIGAVETGPAQGGPSFTVTTSESSGDGNCTTDHCTFQEALLAANANADANSIAFAPGVTGTIFNFPLTITNPVTINGPGARLLAISASTIVGGRILQVSSSNVVITGLTLTNGVVFNTNGGAISNSGGLTMQDCTIKASSANGNDPVGFGGAIYNGNGATLNLTRCTIRDCTAQSYGGGVYNDGNVTATNCTFTGNSGLRGGGMISRAVGGVAIMTLRNCSFTNNTATDGVNAAGFGGGGVYAEGGAQQHLMGNCIIAGNNSTNDRDIRGSYTSQGHNLIGRVGDSAGLVNGSSGDIVGDNTTGVNAQFSSFGNNGGPTDTWSLLSNSPARDAGNNANAPSTDQRGYSRSGVSDIGSFEFNGTAPPLVPIVSVVSSKVHGAQSFGINLPLSGSPGVECRSGGANGDFTVVFTFSNTLTNVGGVSLTSGAGTIALATGINSSDAHQYVVQLTSVLNAQVITVQLTNVNDSLGNNTPVLQVPIGFLLGDTTGNGSVTASDVSQAKLQSGQAVTGSNFRNDINVNGSINATDVSSVKLKSGTALP